MLAGIVVFGGLVGALCLLLGLRLASAGSVALWLGVTPTRMRTNA